MASLGDNITALAVQGTFDDCQALVKRAFADDDLRGHVCLPPANSINLGRLLPQVFYYFTLAGSPACDVVSVPVYLKSGHYEPRPSIETVANAMDVGAPSNFERVQSLYNSDLAALRKDVDGYAYGDARVVAEIASVHRRHGYMLDPHSAIAWLALQDACLLYTSPSPRDS